MRFVHEGCAVELLRHITGNRDIHFSFGLAVTSPDDNQIIPDIVTAMEALKPGASFRVVKIPQGEGSRPKVVLDLLYGESDQKNGLVSSRLMRRRQVEDLLIIDHAERLNYFGLTLFRRDLGQGPAVLISRGPETVTTLSASPILGSRTLLLKNIYQN